MEWDELKEKLIKSKYYYFHINNGVLLNGDCLEVMKELPKECVDLILTDPPYGTTACKWDSIIPFDEMWKCIKIIRKERSPTLLFGLEPFSSKLRVNNIKEFKYDWIWQKDAPSNFFQAKYCPLNNYEIISVFGDFGINSGAKKVSLYKPQGIVEINKEKITGDYENAFLGKAHKTSLRKGTKYVQKYTGYPKRIIKFNRDKNAIHPTQKPIALLEYLIKTYTNENDIVLDFTCGSGSTLVACNNLNRKWIGIEINEEYCEIAKQRLMNKL